MRNMQRVIDEVEVSTYYDLTLDEVRKLMDMGMKGPDGLYEAITSSFVYGYAMGQRARNKEMCQEEMGAVH